MVSSRAQSPGGGSAPDGRSLAAVGRLSSAQKALLEHWLPRHEIVADLSWGLTDGVVLEVVVGSDRYIVKASEPESSHPVREIRAHREWTAPLVALGRAPVLVAADDAARILVTSRLPGELVEGTPAQQSVDTFRQAGELLAAFHGNHATVDAHWTQRQRARVEGFLGRTHRIAPAMEQAIRDEVAT